MPMLSKAQNAAMHAAAQGKSTLGIPKSVGQDFVSASHGESVSALPQRVAQAPQAPRVSSSIQAQTGFAAPKRRRGRHAKQAGAANPKTHQQHRAALNQAYAKGDFSAAKTHALNLAKALHAQLAPQSAD